MADETLLYISTTTVGVITLQQNKYVESLLMWEGGHVLQHADAADAYVYADTSRNAVFTVTGVFAAINVNTIVFSG